MNPRRENKELRYIMHKFCYHYFTDKFIPCGESHSLTLYQQGKQREFDSYIRGIIQDSILYIRIFYPFPDGESKSISDIRRSSDILVHDKISNILKCIKSEYNVIPSGIRYNVTNEMLRDIIVNV